jgi:hypothetical protein
MSQEPYKIVDTKPAWYSRFGSVAVAVGSVATAVVLTVPGMPGSAALNQSAAPADLKTQTPDQANTLPEATPAPQTAVESPAPVVQALPIEENVAKKATAPKKVAPLVLDGISTGNTSSPTPYSAGNGSGSNTSGTETGNTSSPTPAGGSYGDDDDDDEHEDDDHDGREDDDDDDRDDDDYDDREDDEDDDDEDDD